MSVPVSRFVTYDSELYIDEPEEIREYILKDHPEFNIIDSL